jgi:XTP/dITP diphosphohydrolase
MRIFIASSNPGKLRDFAAAAAPHGVAVQLLPGFNEIPQAVEDGATFEENARKKAEHYSRAAAGALVIADDSGLEVDALSGAPGVFSARYAADADEAGNSLDEANNAKLLRELESVPDERRTGRFVCVISVARDGIEIAQFRGSAEGVILRAPRGTGGFGYDPLFFFTALDKSFGELSPNEKAQVSHRGKAFNAFLAWCDANPSM